MNLKQFYATRDMHHIARFHWIPYTTPGAVKVLSLLPFPLEKMIANSELTPTEMIREFLNDLRKVYPNLPEDILRETWTEIKNRIGLVREREPEEIILKICPVCRKEFRPKRNAVYCSPRCRQKAKRLGKETITRREKDDSFMRRCQAPNCNRSLIGKRKSTKYCSTACRVRASRYHQWKARGRKEGSDRTVKAVSQARNVTPNGETGIIVPVENRLGTLLTPNRGKEEREVRNNESGHRPQ